MPLPGRTWLRLAPLLVAGSSVLGLLRVLGFFGRVWTASLWGDLVFVASTLGAFWLAVRVGERVHPAAALVAGFFLHWAAYAASWSVTGPAFSGDGGFLVHAPPVVERAFRTTFEAGFPGLFADAAASCALAWWSVRRGRPAVPAG